MAEVGGLGGIGSDDGDAGWERTLAPRISISCFPVWRVEMDTRRETGDGLTGEGRA